MTSLCNKELSDTLVGLYDDYKRGFDIGEELKLCVDLALTLELELSIHRLSETDTVLKKEIIQTLQNRRNSHSNEDETIDETGTIIQMDFKERN
ncbi:hypothetical protein BHOIPH791_05340 [Bartonella henselae]|uniref:Uncharacterized protein n=2 Tax=Bartonella TaxID=773 RepID=A0A0H3LVZ7_BARHE|nr:hypothetical protein [Bartonella henselae]ATP11783.1 hypothetical protein BhenCHDE101_00735 [Bartonella henselae]ETS09185.1 hypothetical protein Q654_00579 [Bartonella henselae JK 50]ETS09342.1 hypothetical protein Q655_00527 [Bartonella henselae JK 51]ETS09768.1 hypothetical protein Q653_00845 [Bartonella henselae JK 42]ETS12796.1 hypothetical protein Q652_00975 [Bartonella henselae JK 41]